MVEEGKIYLKLRLKNAEVLFSDALARIPAPFMSCLESEY